MPNIILQPASGRDALIHYQKTIENGVSLRSISSHLDDKDKAVLTTIYKTTPLQVWGIVPGENNVNFGKWQKISPGDIVFFSQSGYLVGKAIVTYTDRNEGLARELWGQDADQQTWEYIYFVNEFEKINIPIKRFNKLVGYKENFPIYGVIVIDPARSEEIISNLGSVDEFFREMGIPEIEIPDEENLVDETLRTNEIKPKDLDEIISKIEAKLKEEPLSAVKRIVKQIIRHGKLSKAVKQKYNHRCQVCGEEGFLKRSGKPYAEIHHIIGVSKGGVDLAHNLLVVCANCHRKLEYAIVEFDDEKGLVKINAKEYKIVYT